MNVETKRSAVVRKVYVRHALIECVYEDERGRNTQMKQNKGRNLSVLVFLRLSPSCQHCDFTCIICSGAMESFECHGKMHAKECVAATTIQISQISHTCSSFFSVRLVAAVHLNNLCECAASTCKLFRIYFPWLCITVLL